MSHSSTTRVSRYVHPRELIHDGRQAGAAQLSQLHSPRQGRGQLHSAIFLQFQQDLEYDTYFMFVDALGLPNERHDASGRVMLSRSERDAYNDFVQGLMSSIRSRDFESSITTDATAIEDGLDRLIALEAIDEHAVSWRDVALVFVKDGVTASSSVVKAGILQNFLSLLQHGSDEKEKAIIDAIAFRLEEVDLDIPF